MLVSESLADDESVCFGTLGWLATIEPPIDEVRVGLMSDFVSDGLAIIVRRCGSRPATVNDLTMLLGGS